MADDLYTFTVNKPVQFTYRDTNGVSQNVDAQAGARVEFNNVCDAYSFALGYLDASLGALGASAGVGVEKLAKDCFPTLPDLGTAPSTPPMPQGPPIADPSITDSSIPPPNGVPTTDGLNPPSSQPSVTLSNTERQPGKDDGRSIADQIRDPQNPMPRSDAADALAARGVPEGQIPNALKAAEHNDPEPGKAHSAHGADNLHPLDKVADPVLLFTGQFALDVTDIEIPSRGMPLVLHRLYRSGLAYYGPWGYNWDHNYNQFLRPLSDGGVAVWTGELHEDVYTVDPAGGFEPPTGIFRKLEFQLADGTHSDRYVLTDHQGVRKIFETPPFWPLSDRIPLITIEDRHGNEHLLTYNSDARLDRVTDHANRFLRFQYGDCGLLEVIGDHNNRRWSYIHDVDIEHLIAVITPPTPDAPDGLTAQYEYDRTETHLALVHNIVRVMEPGGSSIVENTYSVDPGSYDFGRVVHQYYGGFEADYEATVLQYVPRTADFVDIPALRVEVVESGILNVYTFNYRGDILDERFRLTRDGSYRLVARVNRYDAQGNLTESREPDGLGVVAEYDAANPDPRRRGNLLRTTIVAPPSKPAPSREIERYTYEPRYGRMKGMRDEAGALTVFVYDYEETNVDHGDVIRIERPRSTLPDGSKQTAAEHFQYAATGQLQKHTSAEGRTVQYEYYSAGASIGFLQRVTRGAPVDGAEVETYAYDKFGNEVEDSDSTGAKVAHEFNALNQATRTIRPEISGSTGDVAYGYGADGRLLTLDSPRGSYSEAGLSDTFLRQTFAYDALGYLAGTTHAANTVAPRAWRMRRNAHGNPLEITDPLGRSLRTDYDERQLAIRHTLSDGIDTRSTTYTYDLGGRMLQATDGAGRIQRFEYDSFGRLSSIEQPGVPGAETRVEYIYGTCDRLIRAVITGVPAPGQVPVTLFDMTQDYDERGRLVRRAQGAMSTVFLHDRDSNVIATIDERGARTTFTYDSVGRSSKRTDALGNIVIQKYDGRGLVTTLEELEIVPGMAQPERFQTSFTYDARRRAATVTGPLGRPAKAVYDDRDLLVAAIDPVGDQTSCDFDAFGDLVASHGPVGIPPVSVTCRFDRDAAGRVTQYLDPEGNATLYAYNLDDRWRRIQLPDGSLRERSFDAVGEVAREQSPAGVVVDFLYGPDGFMERASYTGPPDLSPLPDLVATRDGMGRPVRLIQGSESLGFKYDTMGRLSGETVNGAAISWTADDAAGTADLTYTDGRVDRFHFDLLGRLSTVSLQKVGVLPLTSPSLTPGRILASDEYAGPARCHRRDLANGGSTRFTYDAGRRLSGVAHEATGGVLIADTRYVYDATGRRRVVTREPAPNLAAWYRTDAQWHLAEAVEGITAPSVPANASQAVQDAIIAALGTPTSTRRYSFAVDRSDSRLEQVRVEAGAPTTETYTLDALHQITLLSRSTASGTVAHAVEHDADGHRRSDDRHRYGYDVMGRLIEVRDETGTVVLLTQTYDPLGRVATRESLSAAPERVRSFGGRTIQFENGAGQAVRQRTLGADPDDLVMESDGTDQFALFDGQWTLVAVTNDVGAPTARYAYEPFGVPAAFESDGTTPLPAGTVRIPPQFGGYRALGTTGLYDARARIYDPSTGTFLQRDPRGYASGPNLHAYAGHDPLDRTDTTGEVVPVIIAAAVIIGAVAGGSYAVYDSTKHPELYEGWKAFKGFGYAVGGGVVGWASGVAAVAVGGAATAVVGGATALEGTGAVVAAKGLFVAGAEAAAGGVVWTAGFHKLFPEYVDPPSLKSVAIDFGTGGVLRVAGPVLKQIVPNAVWNSAATGVREVSEGLSRAVGGAWRPIGSEALLVRKYGWQAVERWAWESRAYATKRAEYWKLSGGAAGKHLHHWLIPNSAGRAPLPAALRNLRQAGINHLEVPAALNVWMGSVPRREAAFRNTVFGLLGATGLTAAVITNDVLPKVEGQHAVRWLPSLHGLLSPTPVPAGDGTSKTN